MLVFCSRFLLLLLVIPGRIALSDNTPVLNEVVVTGTRTEKPVLEAPVRTEVVTRQEIEKTHARDLKEALEDVSGLMLKPNEKTGFTAWLQGMDANRVLIVIDGEPISPSTGSSVDLTQIGSMDIERIEIVKGATSALYGSNAMGGVINIITRKPSKPLTYQLSVDGGSYGDKNLSGNASDVTTRRLAANLAVRNDTGYLKLNTDLRDRDGYRLDPRDFRSEGEAGSKANINLRMAWTPNTNSEIFIAPRYYREDVSNNLRPVLIPGVGYLRKRKNEEATRLSATLGAERRLENSGRLRGWLFQENWQDITQQDVLNTLQIEQQRTAEINLSRAELQWDSPRGEYHVFTSGLVFKKSTLNQYVDTPNQLRRIEVNSKTQETVEAYFQDDIFISEQWEIVPGIRIQDDNRFGFYAAPKINAMFTPEWISGVTTNIRMGIGRGYRAPDLKEQYYVFDHSQLGYMILGSIDVDPESSDSYQLGIEFARPGDFRADVTLFRNNIKNLIDTRINPDESSPDLIIYEYENFARALTQGIEFSGNRYWSVFDLKGSYTFLDSENRITGKTLTGRPRHMIKVGADYEHKPWGATVTLRGVYQSKEFFNTDNSLQSPAWTTWDLKLTQTMTSGIKIFAGIDNLTDEHRNPEIPHDQRPQSGRYLYLGLRIEQ